MGQMSSLWMGLCEPLSHGALSLPWTLVWEVDLLLRCVSYARVVLLQAGFIKVVNATDGDMYCEDSQVDTVIF